MRLLHKLIRKIYIIGKAAYEKAAINALYDKGNIDATVRFSIHADLQNLSDNRSAITIGQHCNIEGLILVYAYGGQVNIGSFCSLSPGSRLVSTNKISIGDRVLIAHNVNIIDNNSHPIDAALRHKDFKESYTIGMQQYDLHAVPITIEDDVWIGHNTTILKGVKIGKGAIIGACSVVVNDVEPWTVNVGNPIRVVKHLNDQKEGEI